MARVRLNDIARICGVDISTVSRAIRGDNRVKPATRDKIQQIAEKIGYLPNLLARNLAGGTTRTIWLILPSLDANVDHRFVRSASHQANESDYTLFVALHDSDSFGALASNTSEHYELILERAVQGTTDGVVIIPRRGRDDSKLLGQIERMNLPLVFLDNYTESLQCPIVTTENVDAAAELARRAVASGATGIVILFGGLNPVDEARRAGAQRAVEEAGVPFCFERDVPRQLRSLGPSVAVLGSSQSSSILPFLTKHSAKLLRHRLIFGVFDDWIGEPSPADKVIVAVQDCDRMAREAVDRLIALIERRKQRNRRLRKIPVREFREQTAMVAYGRPVATD